MITVRTSGRPPRIQLVVVAASAGGVEAVSRLLQDLPENFSCPILVVQHLARLSPSSLPHVMEYRTTLRVKWAVEGESVAPGTVYFAVPDRHLTINRNGSLSLSASKRVNWVRPAADVLFESVARNYGPSSLAVVLTGALYDGTAGAVRIKRAGGWVLAQDENSSSCFDMPRAAIISGAVDFVLPLEALSFALSSLVMAPGAASLFRVPCKLDRREALPSSELTFAL